MAKKSQMEVLGLTIVVVLVLLGVFLALGFLVSKNPAKYREGFVSSELASSMLNVIMETNAKDCLDVQVIKLIQNCFEGESICCSDCDNLGSEEKSCSFVQDFVKNDIFAKTLDKWKYGYEFLVYDDLSTKVKVGEGCISEKRSKSFFIPYRSGSATVRLDICG